MAALWNRADHYIFALWFLLLLVCMYVCMYPSGMGPAYSGPIR